MPKITYLVRVLKKNGKNVERIFTEEAGKELSFKLDPDDIVVSLWQKMSYDYEVTK